MVNQWKQLQEEVLFNEILPEVDRDYSKTYGKKQIKALIKSLYEVHGFTETAELINRVKKLWISLWKLLLEFQLVLKTLVIPPEKKNLI